MNFKQHRQTQNRTTVWVITFTQTHKRFIIITPHSNQSLLIIGSIECHYSWFGFCILQSQQCPLQSSSQLYCPLASFHATVCWASAKCCRPSFLEAAAWDKPWLRWCRLPPLAHDSFAEFSHKCIYSLWVRKREQ